MALNAEGRREVGVLVGVDLRQDDLAGTCLRGLLQGGTELLARPAPRCPEVHDDRDLAGTLHYLGLELGLADIDDGHVPESSARLPGCRAARLSGMSERTIAGAGEA